MRNLHVSPRLPRSIVRSSASEGGCGPFPHAEQHVVADGDRQGGVVAIPELSKPVALAGRALRARSQRRSGSLRCDWRSLSFRCPRSLSQRLGIATLVRSWAFGLVL